MIQIPAVKKKYLTAFLLSCMIAKCDDGRGADRMEKIVEQGLLYDFYGELLTAHQRQIYEDAVYHDMSLTEIADIQGISRQGVHDLLRRCDRILEQYEAQLGLVKKFALIKEKAQRIDALAKELQEQTEPGAPQEELSGRRKQDAGTAQREWRETLDAEPEKQGNLAAIRALSREIMEEL